MMKFTTSHAPGGRKPRLEKYFPVACNAALTVSEISSRKPIPRTIPNDRKRSLISDQIPLLELSGGAPHRSFNDDRSSTKTPEAPNNSVISPTMLARTPVE